MNYKKIVFVIFGCILFFSPATMQAQDWIDYGTGGWVDYDDWIGTGSRDGCDPSGTHCPQCRTCRVNNETGLECPNTNCEIGATCFQCFGIYSSIDHNFDIIVRYNQGNPEAQLHIVEDSGDFVETTVDGWPGWEVSFDPYDP